MSCASAVLTSADGTSVNLITGAEGITLAQESDEMFPVPTYDETYISSPDTEGERRVRSRAQNITTSGTVYLDAASATALIGVEETWQQLLEELRRKGGELTYTPQDGDTVITYTILSARLLTLSQDQHFARAGHSTSTFEMTFHPYGRLPETTVVTNANGTDPLLEFVVPELDGSVEALGILSLKDTSSVARRHLEGGLESTYWPGTATDWTLFYDSASMTRGSISSTNTALSGEYGNSSIHGTLTTANAARQVAYVTGTHVGRFRVKARVYATGGTTSVRLGYSIRGGGVSYKQWQSVPVSNAWFEADLGAVSFDEPLVGDQSVTFGIYAKDTAASKFLDVDYLKVIPAERYWRASGNVGGTTTVRTGGTAQVRHDGILTGTGAGVWAEHPNAIGSYLRIPPAGGRIAVAMNRNDISGTTHTPLGDNMRADLSVIPRCLLIGGTT